METTWLTLFSPIVLVILLAIGACFGLAAFVFIVRLRYSLRQLHQQVGEIRERLQVAASELNCALRAVAEDQRNFAHQLVALNFFLGKPGAPSDIVIGELGSYEALDQNWLTACETAGRQITSAAIDGERLRTAVAIILGQSNAANHGIGRYIAEHRVDNFNLYDGRCYHAADPLLGASGDGGNFATRLGDKLIDAGLFDRVILAPIAMGGTMVEQWADEGQFNHRILVLIRRLHDAGLTADFILWQQGEGNPGIGDTGGRQYRKNLLEVVGTFRRYGVNAPFFVALATRCGGAPHPNARHIRAGQKGAVNPIAGIHPGPDIDTIGIEHRWDMCHFDATGLDLAASLWLKVIADFQCSGPSSKAPVEGDYATLEGS